MLIDRPLNNVISSWIVAYIFDDKLYVESDR